MSLPRDLHHGGRSVLLKYHMLNTGLAEHPPNSLSALGAVLRGDVAAIEFDVQRMRDGAFALLHDETLERETSGAGRLRDLTVPQLKALRLRGSDEAPATLAEATELLRSHAQPLKVQVDFKEDRPITPREAAEFLEAIAPLRERAQLRVVVGCLADWNLRLLRRLDATLLVGFDPTFYLHAAGPEPLTPLPTRVNAFGYVDDHPLGHRRAMPLAAYLEDRLECLAGYVPGAVEYYLHKGFVARALEDDVDPIGFLQRHTGALVDVWTLNSGEAGFEAELRHALDAGADQITTDTAVQMAAAAAAARRAS